jgi:acyl-CoA reductase-like NAD-dependent aldehyde dehydrogenase
MDGRHTYSPNTNPSDLSDVIGEYAQGGASDVQAAVAAAAAAFPPGPPRASRRAPTPWTR